jgi:hypothetical protein
MRPLLRLFPAFLLLLAAPAVLRAQDAPSPDAPPPPSKAPAQQEIELHAGQTLKVNVNLVDIYFSARDNHGFLAGLRKDDCQLFEDNKPQVIKNLTQEKNLPLTIGILLDTSGSQTNVLPLEKDSGARFLRDVVTAKDEAFLISFDVNVDLLADFTNSPRELDRAMQKASINTASSSAGIPGIGGGPFPTSNPRGTLLYDAVYLASHDKLQSQTGRKIMVLLTDHPFGMSYGIGFNGSSEMQQLAEQTGGRMINVGNNGKKLDDAFEQIQDELRTQYLASYTPINKEADGKFRKIQLDCGKGVKVQARKGYYAIPGDNDASTIE